ncbi:MULTISPECIES: RHS repeat-associated core domain-containing protein [Rahnella]|uniref:RHS domain-containing protein n=1 Tax=Rahnella laticis TaxID=2787622 RepID=A0ABS0DYK7_9GAMM|nr:MULTISPECIES: RHS repeat-associated core domain-containing protein [Rahnella]MBF7977938.1 RHS domain-containing protein [Rahnella laticis]MBF7998345.1 RHS domain-containing protein [Rahnella sp. LAC-M12]
MTGFPAARQHDMTAIGGPVVQGSLGVMIGAPTGVACSVCPGGVVEGSPVNPSLGAKVLPGETDIALPALLPFVLSRSYSSYKTGTPAPVGMFGPGWSAAADIRLQIRADELILNDNSRRSIHFHLLPPGQIAFSHSEKLWLARGGTGKQPDNHPLSPLWQALPEALRNSPHSYFVANDATGPWWILGCVQLPATAEDVLPRPLPSSRVLLGLSDRFGNQLNYHRDEEGEFAGQITGVTDSGGRRFRLELVTLRDFKPVLNTAWGPDCGVRLSAVWLTKDAAFPDLPPKPLARYDYTPRGELKTVYDRAGETVRQFDWHPEPAGTGLMVAHRYAGRPATRYVYDASGRVVSQVNPGGLGYQFEYSTHQTRVTDSLGRLRVYHFEGERGLRRVVRLDNADGSCVQSIFDSRGGLTSQTDTAGRTTEFHLNPASGDLTEIVHPGGEKRSRFSYNRAGQLISATAPDGRQIRKDYDSSGRLTAETDALNQTRRYHYADDKSAQPCATEDAAGGRQTLEWNASGLLESFTDCSGFKTVYRYNRDGQPVEILHEEGMKTRFAYDARGRRITREDSAGARTRREYNAAGDVITVTRPDGTQSRQTYDERGNPTSQTEGGLTRQTGFDSAGRLVRLTNENGAETHFSYDVMDRLTQETGFDGRVQNYQYDLSGQLIRSDDAGLVMHWHYDEDGQLIRQQRPDTDDGPDEVLWQYDAAGRVNETAHRSETHLVTVRFQYDDNDSLTGERQIIRNAHGDLLWQHTVRHQFDPRGFETAVRYDGLPEIHWQTYGPGHLLGVKLGHDVVLELSRDRLHRETTRRFSQNWQSENAYSLTGQLAGQKTPDVGHPNLMRDYHYNTAGQMTKMTTGLGDHHYAYTPAGRLQSVSSPDGFLATLTDPAGNRSVTHHDLNVPPEDARPVWYHNRVQRDERYLYKYDRYGNLTEKCPFHAGRMHTPHGGGAVTRMAYDQAHRLTRLTTEEDGQTLMRARYIYDPLGRRVGKHVSQINPQSGETQTQNTWFGWDGDRLVLTENRDTQLHTIYHPGSFVPLLRAEHARMEDSHRTLAEKLEEDAGSPFPGDIHLRFNDIEKEIRRNDVSEAHLQWLDSVGLKTESLAPWIEPLPEAGKLKLHLYHCDHLGTPVALINHKTGKVEWDAISDVWGNAVDIFNPYKLRQPIRMQGQHVDEESGLHYNRHRYYDPALGRYITQDPIGLRGGINGYIYAENKPISEFDSIGLSPQSSDNPKCKKAIMQPEITNIFKKMGKNLNVNPLFIMSSALQESGWDMNHVYGTNSSSNGKPLNNIFGMTKAGGNNIAYPSLDASASAWEKNWGPYLDKRPETIQEYAKSLTCNPHHMYNSNPKYPNELAARYKQLLKATADCGVEF